MNDVSVSVSWLYGDFRAVRFVRGRIAAVYHAGAPVTDLPGFNAALAQAYAHLDWPMGRVALCYAGEQASYLSFEAPPMSRADMERYVARRVEQEKPFPETASWSWCSVADDRERSERNVLVHIVPRRMIDAVIRICDEFFLTVHRVVPLSELVGQIAAPACAATDEVVVAAAPTAERATLAVVRADGAILFTRTAQIGEGEERDQRLALEINRTVLFAKQRIGRAVNACALLADADSPLMALPGIDVPLRPVPLDDPHFEWARRVGARRANALQSLVPSRFRALLNRRAVMRAAMAASVALWFAAAAVVLSVEGLIARVRGGEQRMAESTLESRQSQADLEAQVERIELQRDRLAQLSPPARMPVAGFLSGVGGVLAPDLVLTRARIERQGALWRFSLDGDSRLPIGTTLAALEHTAARLQAPPWNAEIDGQWRQTWLQQLRNGGTEGSAVHFSIAGRLH
ncbi:MAG: hypothetical protein AB7Q97_25920 [Gammaproteobacteria bacterium]